MTDNHLSYDAHGLTDRGRCRSRNEDSMVVAPQFGLYVVCDGMGGHVGGEVASRIAADTVEDYIGKRSDDQWPFGRDSELTPGGDLLRNAALLANRGISERIEAEPWLARMGTTLVSALIQSDGHADLANVGDSRAYMLRDGDLRQLTSDHSWVNEQVRMGVLSPAEAERHPLKNVITRALGSVDPLPVDLVEEGLKPGDRLLLCSDGLTTMLDDATIRSLLSVQDLNSEAVCKSLVDAANEAGGEDNITVAVVTVSASGA